MGSAFVGICGVLKVMFVNDILLKKEVTKQIQLNRIPAHSLTQPLKEILNSHVFSVEMLINTF